MNPNQDFMRTTRILKTVGGIVSICSGPIAMIHAIVLAVLSWGLRLQGGWFWSIVMSAMLLSGGITMLVGRSKLYGGVAPIVLFAIGTAVGLLGYLKYCMWVWWLWCLLCLAAAIYFRVSNAQILRGEQVHFDPAGAAAQAAGAVRDWAPQAADAVRTVVDAAGDVVQAARDAAQDMNQNVQYRQEQQPYVPRAAQAAQESYTSPFAPQPSPTLADLQKEILARKAGETVDGNAPAAPAAPFVPAAPAAPAVPAEPIDESVIREAAAAAQEMQQGEGFPNQV